MKQLKPRLALALTTVRPLALGDAQLQQVVGGVVNPPDTKVLGKCAYTTTPIL